MRICFPVQKDEGFESAVYNHFGSAPLFMLVDTEANTISPINNRDQHHTHGACNPLKALDGQQVHAVVVGGIGAGALSKLNQLGISVHRAQGETIKANLDLFAKKVLPVLTLQSCCGGHGHGGGCVH